MSRSNRTNISGYTTDVVSGESSVSPLLRYPQLKDRSDLTSYKLSQAQEDQQMVRREKYLTAIDLIGDSDVYEDEELTINLLGAGAFGKVFRIQDDEEDVAVKMISKGDDFDNVLVGNEIQILKQIGNVCEEYLLCLIDSFMTEDKFYLVTKYVENFIDLGKYIASYPTVADKPDYEMMEVIIENLKDGLKVLHSKGVAHEDIKPSNILVNPSTGEIKYIDMGLACHSKSYLSCDTVQSGGTPYYFSPEKEDRNIKGTWIRQKADIWALGLTIFELFTGLNFYDAYTIWEMGGEDWLKARSPYEPYPYLGSKTFSQSSNVIYKGFLHDLKGPNLEEIIPGTTPEKFIKTFLEMFNSDPEERTL